MKAVQITIGNALNLYRRYRSVNVTARLQPGNLFQQPIPEFHDLALGRTSLKSSREPGAGQWLNGLQRRPPESGASASMNWDVHGVGKTLASVMMIAAG